VYDTLFTKEDPNEVDDPDLDYISNLNPHSLTVLPNVMLEPSLAGAVPGDHFQFMRQGYFSVDPIDSTPGKPVFNRTVTLRDTWQKIQGA
jgi:glutaminyl-tRNA synthetase